jgi:hypothetical protein
MLRPTFLLPLTALFLAAPAWPQSAPATAAIAPATAEDTVNAARRALAEKYVLPEVAARLDAALGAALAAGKYRGLEGAALAAAMHETLREVAPDKHLSVRYDPATAQALAARPPGEEADVWVATPEELRWVEQRNGGVERLERMPGNIRYLDYRIFVVETPAAEQALKTAMEFLRGGDAVIIDIRRNGGGSPDAVAALASYFLPPETKLMRFEMRGKPGEASETGTAPFSLAGKPVYVLTSDFTASAAEEFANHVSAFGFGTLVGEPTAGAGFRNDFVPLPGGLVISVSVGRAVQALTGRDWEGTGIAPAIEVPAEQALARAQAEAMTAIAAAAPEAERALAQRLRVYYAALGTPVDPGAPLADYTGSFGQNVISLGEGGWLTSRAGSRPVTNLIAVGSDLFVAESNPVQQLRFVRGADGAVTALEVQNENVPPVRAEKNTN